MSWCGVRDDFRPGRCGLFISEHHLSSDGEWLHPDELEEGNE